MKIIIVMICGVFLILSSTAEFLYNTKVDIPISYTGVGNVVRCTDTQLVVVFGARMPTTQADGSKVSDAQTPVHTIINDTIINDNILHHAPFANVVLCTTTQLVVVFGPRG